MTGPMPRGHWMRHSKGESWGILHPCRRYEVTRAFFDYDHFEHVVGESWTYLGSAFLPYDDGLSLFVSLDGRQEWHIRMQLRPEEQGKTVDHLQEYLMALPAPPPPPLLVRPGRKAPFILLGLSFAAVGVAFFLVRQSESSPHFVMAGGASMVYAFSAVAMGALGVVGGLIAMIWIALRGARSHA